jgi:hypothetical protein
MVRQVDKFGSDFSLTFWIPSPYTGEVELKGKLQLLDQTLAKK